jgi:hypothetical protein
MMSLVWAHGACFARQGLTMLLRNKSMFLIPVLSALLTAANGRAAFYTVLSTADSNDITPHGGNGTLASPYQMSSLRGAILNADAAGGTHSIAIPAGLYNLTLGKLSFGNQSENITLNGAGPAATIIQMSAVGTDRILLINPAGTTPNVGATIQNLTFFGGILTSDFSGGAAILAGGPNNSLSISNCIFNANTVPGGRGPGGAISLSGGGSLALINSSFINNATLDAASAGGGAVLFFLESVVSGSLVVSGCTFSNNVSLASSANAGGGGALAILAQASVGGTTFSSSITGNRFVNNQAGAGYGGALLIENAFGGTIHVNYNRFAGNTAAADGSGLAHLSAVGNTDAVNNWWGCNTGPGPGGCADTAIIFDSGGSGTLNYTPWLQLKHYASPGTILVNKPATLTVSFLTNSAGTTIAASNLGAIAGARVTFGSAVKGTLSAAQTSIQSSGTATATFTAGATGGAGSATATVDNATVTASITIQQPPVVNCPANIQTNAAGGVCLLPAVPFAATATGIPTPAIFYRLAGAPITSPMVFPLGTNVVVSTATNAVGTNSCTFTVTVLPGTAPRLSLVHSGSNAVLSWPTNFGCYTLQYGTALASNAWVSYPGPLSTNGGNIFATNTVSGGIQFFRLAR